MDYLTFFKSGMLKPPVPKDNDVLIKVYGATVAVADINLRAFNFPKLFWLFARIDMGIRGPKKQIMGLNLLEILNQVKWEAKK